MTDGARATAAVDRALASSERLAAKAKEVTEVLSDRSKKATASPVVIHEVDEEDSLVTCIASLIASAKHA